MTHEDVQQKPGVMRINFRARGPEALAVISQRSGVNRVGHRVAQEGPLEIWVKALADGSKAVAVFNRNVPAMAVTAYSRDIGAGP
jgi:alpha-galactosidase